jgi:predicted transcriptional regulator
MILLSIYPEHVESIIKGLKKYEFRKISLKRNAQREKFIVVYETKPMNSIRIIIKTGKVIEDNINNLWNRFGAKSGISKNYFFEYYRANSNVGSPRGIAIEIDKIFTLKKPISLSEIREKYPNFVPPQNLYLVNEEKYPLLHKQIKKEFKLGE